MKKISEITDQNYEGIKKYLIAYNPEEFEMGKWKDGTVTLGFITNKKAAFIKPGDKIFMYLKVANLIGTFEVMEREKWKKVRKENFETPIQFEEDYDFVSENQFTMRPLDILDKPIDFRSIVDEISFTAGRGSSWGHSLRGFKAIQLLNREDSEFLEKIITKHKEKNVK